MLRWRYNKPTREPTPDIGDPEILIFTKKEIVWMLIVIILATFVSFVPIIPNDEPVKIISRLAVFALIIVGSVTAKKLIAPHYSIKIENRIYMWRRWGFYKRAQLKKDFPMGLVFPFIISLFTLGFIKPFTFLQFDAENVPESRILKQHGARRQQRKEEITEEDLGYTCAASFYFLLFLALFGAILSASYNLQFGKDLAKFSIYYGIWNLVPYGRLDGSKLFFGVTQGWFFITALYVISLISVIITQSP